MTENTSRVRQVQPSSSRSLEEDLRDVDEVDIAVRPQRAEKCPAEPPVQQKSMEDSPSPAPNGLSQGLSSQRQAAQLHSGQLRVNSAHLLPYNGTGQHTIPSNSGRSKVNLDFSASDIAVPVTISSKNNTWHGEERIVFENAADMVRYYTWFVNPFVRPAENDALLESYWVNAATKLGWRDVEMGKSAMTFLKSRLSSARSHLVSESKNTVEDIYDFAHKPPNEIKAWRTTWQGLPPEVRKKLADDTKKHIKKMLREGGYIQDQESRAPLEDKEAAAYMELEISGDEESEAEEDNSDPEGGDDVEALEEEWDEDE
ncbi:hypothetical protein HOY82DRAFT_595296 [Tuber indicum]|nr:hypothetical protein HOY82DRAFT_595296 [Tuber indicum]